MQFMLVGHYGFWSAEVPLHIDVHTAILCHLFKWQPGVIVRVLWSTIIVEKSQQVVGVVVFLFAVDDPVYRFSFDSEVDEGVGSLLYSDKRFDSIIL